MAIFLKLFEYETFLKYIKDNNINEIIKQNKNEASLSDEIMKKFPNNFLNNLYEKEKNKQFEYLKNVEKFYKSCVFQRWRKRNIFL